jgi:hypothetical protein
VQVELNADALTQTLSAAGESDAKRREQAASMPSAQAVQQMAMQGMRFYAFDPDQEALQSGISASLTILLMDSPAALAIDVLEARVSVAEQFACGYAPIAAKRVDLDGTQALRVRYTADMPGVFGDLVPTDVSQLVVPVGTTVHVVTASAPAALNAKYADLIDEILLSYRVTSP